MAFFLSRRAALYFLLRYPEAVANSSKEMPKENQVDTRELTLHRNRKIQKLQRNRNPFNTFF